MADQMTIGCEIAKKTALGPQQLAISVSCFKLYSNQGPIWANTDREGPSFESVL